MSVDRHALEALGRVVVRASVGGLTDQFGEAGGSGSGGSGSGSGGSSGGGGSSESGSGSGGGNQGQGGGQRGGGWAGPAVTVVRLTPTHPP